jgi:hypothetical protein
VLLDALSRARKDKSTDAVSRNATIAVDVGDVTLVSSLWRCIKFRDINILRSCVAHLAFRRWSFSGHRYA